MDLLVVSCYSTELEEAKSNDYSVHAPIPGCSSVCYSAWHLQQVMAKGPSQDPYCLGLAKSAALW